MREESFLILRRKYSLSRDTSNFTISINLYRLIEECGVAMYCDMHAHSRKHNIFIYGCENKRNPEKKLTEQVFPLMLHKNSADRVRVLDPHYHHPI